MSREKDISGGYVLDDQVGFILRRVSQRHAGIFAEGMVDKLTPTQFAALAKLYEMGSCTQNRLGRMTAMDAATIKGVIDRLGKRGLTCTWSDPTDGRRMLVGLTDKGRKIVGEAIPRAMEITEKTVQPLGRRERETLLRLLRKLC